MSADLVPHPTTGEALDLTADDDTLAFWLDQLRELERQSKEAREEIGRELIRRMDRQAKWTIHTERGLKVTAPSPAPKYEWNVEALRNALGNLGLRGLISQEAVAAAIEEEIRWKPKPAGLNALMKLGGEVEAKIVACRTEVEVDRRVSVKTDR